MFRHQWYKLISMYFRWKLCCIQFWIPVFKTCCGGRKWTGYRNSDSGHRVVDQTTDCHNPENRYKSLHRRGASCLIKKLYFIWSERGRTTQRNEHQFLQVSNLIHAIWKSSTFILGYHLQHSCKSRFAISQLRAKMGLYSCCKRRDS